VRAVARLYELYPGIYLTTEEKARKILSQGSRRIHKIQCIFFIWRLVIPDDDLPILSTDNNLKQTIGYGNVIPATDIR
jgi:hypothetical protein